MPGSASKSLRSSIYYPNGSSRYICTFPMPVRLALSLIARSFIKILVHLTEERAQRPKHGRKYTPGFSTLLVSWLYSTSRNRLQWASESKFCLFGTCRPENICYTHRDSGFDCSCYSAALVPNIFQDGSVIHCSVHRVDLILIRYKSDDSPYANHGNIISLSRCLKFWKGGRSGPEFRPRELMRGSLDGCHL